MSNSLVEAAKMRGKDRKEKNERRKMREVISFIRSEEAVDYVWKKLLPVCVNDESLGGRIDQFIDRFIEGVAIDPYFLGTDLPKLILSWSADGKVFLSFGEILATGFELFDDVQDADTVFLTENGDGRFPPAYVAVRFITPEREAMANKYRGAIGKLHEQIMRDLVSD